MHGNGVGGLLLDVNRFFPSPPAGRRARARARLSSVTAALRLQAWLLDVGRSPLNTLLPRLNSSFPQHTPFSIYPLPPVALPDFWMSGGTG